MNNNNTLQMSAYDTNATKVTPITENPAGCPFEMINEEVVWDGKWIQTRQVNFKTADGQNNIWQYVHRNTKPSSSLVDGVSIIARLRRDNRLFIVLLKQFRIPTGKICLELPAGLIDEGETATQAAIRELKEETGYTANKVVMESKQSFLDPGLTDDSQCIVILDIDGDAEENKNPVQELEITESIEVILVEQSQLMSYINNLDSSMAVDSGLLSYAMGLQFAQI